MATNLYLNLVLISRQWNLQIHSKPQVLTAAVCAKHLELQRELLNLIQLQKQGFLFVSFFLVDTVSFTYSLL
jgi:hypothetical protein